MQGLTVPNSALAIAGCIAFAEKPEGYPIIHITTPAATATVALQGAHAMTFQPHGQQPVLWLSEEAKFAPGKSVRGGVPVCWPWFGPHAQDPAKPGHGHARTVPWQLRETRQLENGAAQLTLELLETAQTQALWPFATPAQLRVTVADSLTVELLTRNTSAQPVTIGEALHTYFAVSDIGAVRIVGLDGSAFYDKTDNMARKIQQGNVRIDEEMDRVYVDTRAECVIEDSGWQRRIVITKENSQSTVIWNPWAEKAAKMGDFGGPEGYRRMVCVESGNAMENAVVIPPDGEHRMMVNYRVETLGG